MRIRFICCVLVSMLTIAALGLSVNSQTGRGKRQKRGAVCFDPTVPCKTTATFEAHDLPFRIPTNAPIWESEPFYAIILQSVRLKDEECETKFIPEDERLAAQALFPNRKVFTNRCDELPGNIFYSNTKLNTNFMAVYAGRTQAEAARMLASVKATGKFPTANIRRMYAGFNGT